MHSSSLSFHKARRVVGGALQTLHNNCSYVELLVGNACKVWRGRGEDQKGTGRRCVAEIWPYGISEKQKKSLYPRKGFNDETVSSNRLVFDLPSCVKCLEKNWQVYMSLYQGGGGGVDKLQTFPGDCGQYIKDIFFNFINDYTIIEQNLKIMTIHGGFLNVRPAPTHCQ